MPVEEGDRYRLGGITFTGNKAVTNTKALRGTFAIKDGDWFNATMIGKGLENLKKAYGQLGYINFGAIPKPIYDDQKKTVSLDIDIDEGKPFYVSRIEFQGNTITRDKVIRRELLLDEGQVYNSQLWEYSLLRLNQLEYFDPLKVDQDSEAHQDTEAGTVDLLLKVKEKGKNSIGLNGGVSGLSGAFLGVNYQTNNFLGLGETLSLQGNLGNVQRAVPVRLLRSRTCATARSISASSSSTTSRTTTRQELPDDHRAVGQPECGAAVADAELQPGVHRTELSAQLSAQAPCLPARRHDLFADKSTIHRLQHRIADLLPDHQLPVRHSGQNALAGIINSSASFSYIYNTINNPVRPRTGKEYTAVFQIAGIGGNVRYISPLVAYKRFIPCTT
jgi:outer membrane protein insertion porin family